MILLTDEEIEKLPKIITTLKTTGPRVVAKAKLKKVADELKKHMGLTNENTLVLTIGKINKDNDIEFNDWWQALLKEVE